MNSYSISAPRLAGRVQISRAMSTRVPASNGASSAASRLVDRKGPLRAEQSKIQLRGAAADNRNQAVAAAAAASSTQSMPAAGRMAALRHSPSPPLQPASQPPAPALPSPSNSVPNASALGYAPRSSPLPISEAYALPSAPSAAMNPRAMAAPPRNGDTRHARSYSHIVDAPSGFRPPHPAPMPSMFEAHAGVSFFCCD